MSLRTTQGNLEGGRRRTLLFRLLAAVLAGTVAIVANMALLSFANNAGITTGNGGLLRLFAMMIQRLAWFLHLIDGRSNLPLPSPAALSMLYETLCSIGGTERSMR